MSASRGGPLRVLAWPRDRSRNPYTTLLYESVATTTTGSGHGVEIEEFRIADAWRHHADVVHVHWPEACVESPSALRAAAKTAMFLFALRRLRARGATVVWTCHNVTSHEGHHPRIEAQLRRRFLPMVDGVIHLSADGAERAEESIPALRSLPHAVIRPGTFTGTGTAVDRGAARAARGIATDDLVLASIGGIRPYKNVPELIRVFRRAGLDRIRLVVAGDPSDEALRDEVVAAAAGASGVELDLGWVPDDALDDHFAVADAVVLPYRSFHNSGAAVLALSHDRPVAITRSGAVDDLVELIGEEWVLPLDGELTPDTLSRVVDWARLERDPAPDLTALSWDAIGRETVAAYERFSRTAVSGA